MPDQRVPGYVVPRTVTLTGPHEEPIPDLEVVRIASNGTYVSGRTDARGTWTYQEHFTGTVTLLAAGERWRGASMTLNPEDWTDSARLVMGPEPEGGSVIIEHGAGFIPGLDGRLNPIRDSLGRTYVYGDNLSFNELPDQPLHTATGTQFTVSDSVGNMFKAELVVILGRTSLISFRRLQSSPLEMVGSVEEPRAAR